MGIFNDLGFKKNSSGQIVSPNSAKINGKSVAELQTELVNRVNSDIVLSPDVDGVASFTSFTNASDTYASSVKLLMNGNDLFDKTGKTLTNSGVTVDTTTKKYGTGSLYFNGNSYISVPSSSDFDFGTGDFTIEAWVNPTSLSSGDTNINSTIVAIGTYGSKAVLNINMFPTKIVVSIGSGAWGWDSHNICNCTNNLNTWTHIAVSKSSGVFFVFKDGILIRSFSNTTNLVAAPLYTSTYFGNPSYSLTGYIDDLRVTKGVARYTATFTPPTEELYLLKSTQSINQAASQNNWYKYQATAYDLTSGAKLYINGSEQTVSSYITDTNTKLLMNGNDLLDKTGKTVTNNGVVVDTSTFKYGTGSLYFNGSSYLTIPSSTDFAFGTGDFTIECWFKTSQTTSNATLFTREWGASNSGGLSLQLNGNNSSPLTVYMADYNTSSTFLVSSNSNYRDNLWHHVAIVRSGNTFTMYLDGVSVASNSFIGALSTTTTNFTIGNDTTFGSGTRKFNGYIDDFRITKGIARYTTNFTPTSSELLYINNGTVFNTVQTNTRQLNLTVLNGSASKVDINLYTGVQA